MGQKASQEDACNSGRTGMSSGFAVDLSPRSDYGSDVERGRKSKGLNKASFARMSGIGPCIRGERGSGRISPLWEPVVGTWEATPFRDGRGFLVGLCVHIPSVCRSDHTRAPGSVRQRIVGESHVRVAGARHSPRAAAIGGVHHFHSPNGAGSEEVRVVAGQLGNLGDVALFPEVASAATRAEQVAGSFRSHAPSSCWIASRSARA